MVGNALWVTGNSSLRKIQDNGNSSDDRYSGNEINGNGIRLKMSFVYLGLSWERGDAF